MKPYPYQEKGVEWLLAGRRRYLADEAGLGKTVQVAFALDDLRPTRPCLVACPASVRGHWQRTLELLAPYEEVHVVSYAGLTKRGYDGSAYAVVILDEAHYVKSPSAKRTKVALQYAAAADRAWLLSATPTPNHPGELYTAGRMLWPEWCRKVKVRSYDGWLKRFTKYWELQKGRVRRKVPYAPRNTATLQRLWTDISLRRTAEEVGLELPPLRVDVQYLDPKRVTFPDEIHEVEFTSTERRLLGSAKVDEIVRVILEEAAQNPKARYVVFAHHLDVIDALEEKLDTLHPLVVTGAASRADRDAAIAAFTNDARHRVFIGQQQAAGTGINLQVASEVILVEPSWVPAENYQAIKRIHRIGAQKPCRARIFPIPGTLDDDVMVALARTTRMNGIQEDTDADDSQDD